MDDKEQISTLISVGAGLPPINPDLDDLTQDDSNVNVHTHKNKAGRKSHNPPESPPVKAITDPDPKEYIAELERSEEDLY